ncbi:MAG: GNAT family N-acetyltransferase [Thermoleophilaceae bacterium]
MADRSVEVRALGADEVPTAVAVLARGMRDNPNHVAIYGGDAERRERLHGRLMAAFFATSTGQEPLCAVSDGEIVGVAGVAPAGTCRPGPRQGLRMIPALLRLGPVAAGRVAAVASAWAQRDPDEQHLHLGPVAVDRPLQGQGIGSELMAAYCRRLDEEERMGYLETDERGNVDFYRRFGFEVSAETTVLGGVPNWFMRRPAPG